MEKEVIIIKRKLKCWLHGHDLIEVREVTDGVTEYRCERCGREFVSWKDNNMLLLDDEMRLLDDFLHGDISDKEYKEKMEVRNFVKEILARKHG